MFILQIFTKICRQVSILVKRGLEEEIFFTEANVPACDWSL
jgi:hypothetical protein